MLPGFTEAVTDAASSAWNWIRGNKKTDDKSDEAQNTSSEPESEEIPKISTATPLPKVIDPYNVIGELLYLKAEAIVNATNRTKDAKAKAEHIHNKTKKFTSTLGSINKQSANDGSFEVSETLKPLLAEMKAFGIANADPNKKKYTKEEARKLTDEMKLSSSNLDTDLRLKVNEMQECVHHRNLYFQEIKALFDKFFEILKRIISGIISR